MSISLFISCPTRIVPESIVSSIFTNLAARDEMSDPTQGQKKSCGNRTNAIRNNAYERKSWKYGSLPCVTKNVLTMMPPGYYISPEKVCEVSPGCVVWLPAKENILPDTTVDKRLHAMSFNHPAVICSVPCPLTHDSVVEIAIVGLLGALYRS